MVHLIKLLIQIFYFLELLKNVDLDCWDNCGKKDGQCSWCGSEGYCCTMKDGYEHSNGCDGTFGGREEHRCDLKPGNKCMILCLILSIFYL